MFQQTSSEDMILFKARNLEITTKSSSVRNKIYEENRQNKKKKQKKKLIKIKLVKIQVLTANIHIQ